MTIKTFVLIYMIWSYSPHGLATSTIEFSSLGECDRAGKQLEATWSSGARYVCVEKTTIPVAPKH